MTTGVGKKELRAQAQKNREGLAPDSHRVCRGLAHWLTTPGRSPGWVVSYAAMPGEVDLAALVAEWSDLGPFALTRTPEAGRTLSVHPYDSDSEVHRFGYRQPVAGAEVVADSDIAVVLVPALAFDREGQRLGWGAGFYDRFLARLAPDVVKIGISDGFLLDRIPAEPHDIAMDLLATEAGVMQLPLRP